MASKAKNAVPISKIESEDKWQAQDDLRTLIKAEQIKADPKRYSAAQKAAKARMAEVEMIEKMAGEKD